jgi:hypothetical protein
LGVQDGGLDAGFDVDAFWGWRGAVCSAVLCPVGFDFDGIGFAGGVVVEAAPAVVFGLGDEIASYWVAVDVLNLLDVFLDAGHVEVVVAGLPELFVRG